MPLQTGGCFFILELPQSQGFKLVISWVTEEANARVYIRVFFAFR